MLVARFLFYFPSIQVITAVASVKMLVNLIYAPFFHTKRNLKWYNPDEAQDVYPNETPYDWLATLGKNWRATFRDKTEYPIMGKVLAGEAEFPWVVEIRNSLDNAEHGHTGNLISDLWVLTACSMVDDWDEFRKQGGFTQNPAGKWVVWFFPSNYREHFIRYSYANEELYHLYRGSDTGREPDSTNPDYAGTRRVERVLRHPRCDTTTRLSNFLLIKVNNPIPTYVPVIGYMPVFDASSSINGPAFSLKSDSHLPLVHMKGGSSQYKKMVCYVASVSREYNNYAAVEIKGYKVKYRAYYDETYCFQETYKLYEPLCTRPREQGTSSEVIDQGCEDTIKNKTNFSPQGSFECFRTYSKYGAVCDHDTGAPLVCDGEVYGFVTRGVPYQYCLHSRMFPFVVINIKELSGAHLWATPPALPYFLDPSTD